MRAIRILVGATATAAALWAAAVAVAASPHSVTVGPSDTSSGWGGKNYLLGKTASPSLCPASTDPLDTLCDHVSLTVDVSSGYWDTHTGSASVSISWGSSSDNFDLYLYSSSGHLVVSSAQSSTHSESVTVSKPAGRGAAFVRAEVSSEPARDPGTERVWVL